jgi:hypothetical protein
MIFILKMMTQSSVLFSTFSFLFQKEFLLFSTARIYLFLRHSFKRSGGRESRQQKQLYKKTEKHSTRTKINSVTPSDTILLWKIMRGFQTEILKERGRVGRERKI